MCLCFLVCNHLLIKLFVTKLFVLIVAAVSFHYRAVANEDLCFGELYVDNVA